MTFICFFRTYLQLLFENRSYQISKWKPAKRQPLFAVPAEYSTIWVCGLHTLNRPNWPWNMVFVWKEKTAFFSYYDHFSEIVLQLGYENISAHNIILPEVQQLLDYDKDNSSNYYESLNCYLSERCDMTKAAAKLFLHRNSLMYRIKKCEEIMDVRLDDAKTFEKLYLCCTIREMKKQSFFQ